jgi:hypothetical protein
MPSLTDRKKKKKAKKAPDAYPVQHILTPARQLAEAKRGAHVTALCGATVTGDPVPEAGICAGCVIAQFEADDKAFDSRAQQRFDAGKTQGVNEGRREADAQRASAEREQADAARKEFEKQRFEDHGATMKFTFEDGSEATMRKDRISSVRFAPPTVSSTARVLVDGVVLFSHADEALVRTHHTQVHDAVFGAGARSS